LTPYPSGQTLGGSLFKLRSPTSGTLLYALGINHTSERHLSGTVLLSSAGISEGGLGRPDLLLVEAGRSERKGVKMKEKVAGLLGLITKTLTQEGGNLLFPVDASPRLLELLVLLDQHWAFQQAQAQAQFRRGPGPGPTNAPGGGLWNFPLCLVSRTGEEGVRVARSLMEWMGGTVASDEGLGSAQDNARQGGNSGPGGRRKRPFPSSGVPGSREEDAAASVGALRFKYLRFYPSVRAYETDPALAAQPGPRCVLAVPMSMNYGFSRRLFTSMAKERTCKVVLTGRSETGTLGQELFEHWNEVQQGDAKYGEGRVGVPVRLTGENGHKDKSEGGSMRIKVVLNDKVALEGDELEAHLEAERLQKEKEAAALVAKERSRRMLEADDLESDSDDDDDDDDDVENGLGAGDQARDDEPMMAGPIGATGTGAGNPFMDTDDVRNTSFDIYVKGQQVRSTGFFKNAPGSSSANASGLARFRMFPFVERKGRRVDAYGEGIDVGAWVRKGREIEEDQESDEVKEAKRKQKEEEEKAVSSSAFPSWIASNAS
jgi:cleavage and polyadenylation specificity factor subunit 2